MLPQYGSYVQRGGVMVGVGERVERAEKERVAHEGPAMRGRMDWISNASFCVKEFS